VDVEAGHLHFDEVTSCVLGKRGLVEISGFCDLLRELGLAERDKPPLGGLGRISVLRSNLRDLDGGQSRTAAALERIEDHTGVFEVFIGIAVTEVRSQDDLGIETETWKLASEHELRRGDEQLTDLVA
jgi:hypothetical protein